MKATEAKPGDQIFHKGKWFVIDGITPSGESIVFDLERSEIPFSYKSWEVPKEKVLETR